MVLTINLRTYVAALAVALASVIVFSFPLHQASADAIGVNAITYPAPTLTDVSSSVTSGGTVTLTGTHLDKARWVFIYNSAGQWSYGFGQGQTGFKDSDNSLSFTLDSFMYKYIGGAGTYQIDVVTAGGTSNVMTFTVTSSGSTTVSPIAPAAPTLSGVTPAAVNSGDTVTVNGAHLQNAKYVFVYNAAGQWSYGLGAKEFTASSNSVSFTLDSFMYKYIGGAGTYTIDVVTPGGTSNLVTFTTGGATEAATSPITAGTPTLTSVTPTPSVTSGDTVTINGAHLQSAKYVFFYNAEGQWVYGLGAKEFTASSDSVSFTLDSFMYKYIGGAGTYQVDVVTPGGTSKLVTFKVTKPNPTTVSPIAPAAPTLSSASPASVAAGNTVTLNGANLQNAKWVFFYDAQGHWVDGFGAKQFVATSNGVTFTVDSSMANYMGGAGTYQADVVTPGGTSNTVIFTITDTTTGSSSHTPTLTSTSPASVNAGQMLTLNGTDLQNAKWIFFYNAAGQWAYGFGINGSNVIASPTSVSFTLDSYMYNYMGGAGTYQADVVTPDGTTNLITFTTGGATKTAVSPIAGTAPTLNGVTPATVNSGDTVTLNGSNLKNAKWVFFYNAAGQWAYGFGTNQSGVTASDNSVSFTADSFMYKYMGGAGTYTADVVTPYGTSNKVTFTLSTDSADSSSVNIQNTTNNNSGSNDMTISQLQVRLQSLLQQLAQIKATVAPNSTPLCTILSAKSLRQGSFGADVTALQNALKSAGYFSGTATGYYGPTTQRAVQIFQSAQGIVSSGTPSSTGYGVFGPRTRNALVHHCTGNTSTETSFTASPMNGTAPLTVQFTASVPSSSSEYAIDFGDGTQAGNNWGIYTDGALAGQITQSHTYAANGTYTAILYVPPTMPTTCPASSAPCGQHIATVKVTVGTTGAVLGVSTTNVNNALEQMVYEMADILGSNLTY